MIEGASVLVRRFERKGASDREWIGGLADAWMKLCGGRVDPSGPYGTLEAHCGL